jgi:hypothetical protein
MDQWGGPQLAGTLSRSRGSSMPTTNRHSWQQHQVGRVHLTVEAEPADADRNLARHRGLAQVISQLFDVFDRHKLPATWAVGDPAHSAVAALVVASETQHSLAVLGDRYWIGATAGRTRFARELARRLSQARAAGIQAEVLVPRVAPVAEHIDLIVKQGVRAVLATNGETKRPASRIPRALHYGVWEFAITDRFPMRSSWLSGGDWTLHRRLRRAAREAATFHLLIDASALEEAGRSATNKVERLMRRVANLRDRGIIQVETLAQAADRLSDLPATTPQRSILRPAA